jgi:hypothetical protein
MQTQIIGGRAAHVFDQVSGSTVATGPGRWEPAPFMPVSSEIYSHILQFLIYEALLLDHGCIREWAQLMGRDVSYSVRNCSGQDVRGEGCAEYTVNGRNSLMTRLLEREEVAQSGTRLPLTRRFVTNICVTFGPCHKQYNAVSYLRVAHIGHDGATNSAWSAERRDRILAVGRSLFITHREVLIDAIEPGMSGLPRFV